MNDEYSPQSGGSRFQTTRWSLVVAAGNEADPGTHEALAKLIEDYWRPVYSYVRRRGHDIEAAQDLTQGFFADLLARRGIGRADPQRGRFRSFLLASVKHFLANERDKELAAKRGGGLPLLALEFEVEEGHLQIEPVDEETPEMVFEKRWAMAILERVTRRLHSERATAEDPVRFDGLLALITDHVRVVPYREVAVNLGMTEDAVKAAVYRLRRRFGQLVRDEVAETVQDPAVVEDEIRFLLAVLER